MSLPIIIFFPLLLLFTSNTRFYPQFFVIARWWAYFILYGMGFRVKVHYEERMVRNGTYVIVANHTSMTDIMLMLVTFRKPFVFVGKAELAKIPLFGFFYRRTCILVERGSQRSRKQVFERAQPWLEKGVSICIFPEGGVPDDGSVVLDSFKDGAFRMAVEHQLPVVPVVFYDNKVRFPYSFFRGSPGRMYAKVKTFILPAGNTAESRKELRDLTRKIILKELESKTAKTYN